MLFFSQRIKRKRLATYYGDIGVGVGVQGDSSKIQNFRMLFDTGSCEFWIPSDTCTTSRCLTHRRYSKSNSFQTHNGVALAITYLSGKVMGQMAEETITLGGSLQVHNQVIGIADEVEIPLLDEVVWDGILGLAFANNNLKKQMIKPIFDNMIEQKALTSKGEKNQFTYYLGNEIGAVSFGGPIEMYKRSPQEDFVWAPITEEYYWTIALTNIRKVAPGNNPSEGMKTASKDALGDVVIDNCEKKSQLPNIVIELKGYNDEYLELTLTPDDYVLQFNIDGKDDCVVGIAPDGEDNGFTLGQVFLKAFYTVFDRDQKRIGFVRSNDALDETSIQKALDEAVQNRFVSKEEKPVQVKQKETLMSIKNNVDPQTIKNVQKTNSNNNFGNWKFMPFGLKNKLPNNNFFQNKNVNNKVLAPIFSKVLNKTSISQQTQVKIPENTNIVFNNVTLVDKVSPANSNENQTQFQTDNSNGPIPFTETQDDDSPKIIQSNFDIPSQNDNNQEQKTENTKRIFKVEPATAVKSNITTTDLSTMKDGPLPDSMIPDDDLPMFKSKEKK